MWSTQWFPRQLVLLGETFSQKIKNNEVKEGSVIYTLGKVDSVSFRNSVLIVSFEFGFPWYSRYKLGVSFIPSCICQWYMCVCMLVCCLTVQLRLPFTTLPQPCKCCAYRCMSSFPACNYFYFIFNIFNFVYDSVCMYVLVGTGALRSQRCLIPMELDFIVYFELHGNWAQILYNRI